MEASENFAGTVVGPARTSPALCLVLLGACHANKTCAPLPRLSSLGGSCGLRYLQCSSQAASTGNRERSPVDCAVFALYISWEPFDVCLRSLDSARRLRAACVISPEKCCFHVGQGTQAEKSFPRALFCCRKMFRLWWVSTELFSPFPFSPTVEWSSGFWQGKHTWQAAAPRETGPLVLGWGLGMCRSILCFSKGSARAVLQLAQGRRKNNLDIAGLLPTASVFFLICPKKHSRQALCFQALVVPACRHFCCTSAGVNQRGVNQSKVIPCWQ